MIRPPPGPPLFPYTTLFRSGLRRRCHARDGLVQASAGVAQIPARALAPLQPVPLCCDRALDVGQERRGVPLRALDDVRSEEHTSELQSHSDLVCRLLLEKKN